MQQQQQQQQGAGSPQQLPSPQQLSQQVVQSPQTPQVSLDKYMFSYCNFTTCCFLYDQQ